MQSLGSQFDLKGGELYNARIENISTGADWDYPLDGMIGYVSGAGEKYLAFYDSQIAALVKVPRLNRNEIWTGIPDFSAQFTVGSAALITNLNANLLNSLNSSATATASTIAARSAGGIVRGEDPVDPTDLVNLRYMQANLRNAVDKGAVRVSTIVSLPAYAFSANEMVASANGVIPAQDGVTLAVNDLVAVLYEGGAGSQYYQGTAHALNGIYKVTDIGTAGTPWKMIRAINADVTSEVTPGMFFAVSEGTNQSNSTWTLFTDGPIVLRTDAPKGLAAVTAAGGALTASTAYYYRVTMVDFSGAEAATTTEVTATTDVTNKTINLSWTAYSEAVSYRIYRSLVSGTYGATTLAGTTTGIVFSDTGVALSTGTPPTASALQFAKTGSNAFYSGGNGIDISGTVISTKIEGSTTYVANRILFNGSTTTIDSDANLTWDAATMTVTGALTVTGTTTLATTLTGLLKGASGVVSAALPGTTAGMTAGTIAKFSASTPFVTDSIITESGTTITISGSITATGTTTLATSLTGMLKGASGVVSAVTGATNRVTFWSDANTISSAATFVWDATGLGVGTSSPQHKLVVSNAGAEGLEFNPATAAGVSMLQSYNRSGAAYNELRLSGSLFTFYASGAEKWQITAAGILQANGAQTIQSSTGNLTIATAAGNGNVLVTPHGTGETQITNGLLSLSSSVAGGSKFIYFTNGNATSTGSIIIQPGGGSGGFGGGLILYSHAHASFPGWARIGLSTGSTGKFAVNTSGIGDGTDVFTVDSSGNVSLTGARTISNTTGILTVTGTGGLTLSTAANTNILLSPNGTGMVGIGMTPIVMLDVTGNMRIQGSNVDFQTFASGASANNGLWLLRTSGSSENLTWQVENDARSVATTFFQVERTGTTVDSITLSATSVGISYLTAKSILFAGASGAVSQENSVFQYITSADGGPGMSIGDTLGTDRTLYAYRTGAKTVDSLTTVLGNISTSSTASVSKFGLHLTSTGTWNGASAVNYGIYINAISGGTTNWALYNNTAANVYLGTGLVGIGTTGPVFQLNTSKATGNQSSIGITSGASSFVFAAQDVSSGRSAISWDNNSGGATNIMSLGFGAVTAGVPANPVLSLNQNGNVGIATTAPSTLLHVGLAGTTLGTIGIAGNTSGLVTIQPAAAAGTWTLTLPTSGGTADYFLKTNGSGVSSWSNSLAANVTIAGVAIPRIVAVLIGAGTDPIVTHNLNTQNVVVQVRRVLGPFEQVLVDNDATDNNNVTFHFRTAPGSGVYLALIMAS